MKMQNLLFANINTEVYNNMVLSTFDPLQHIMDNAFFIVLICMENPPEYKGLMSKLIRF